MRQILTPTVLQTHGSLTCGNFPSIAALCGDGLRPELQALFDRLAVDPHSELFVRADGMLQSGPAPKSKAPEALPIAPKRVA